MKLSHFCLLFWFILFQGCDGEEQKARGHAPNDTIPADTLTVGDTTAVEDSTEVKDTVEAPVEGQIYGPPAGLKILGEAIHFYVFGDFGRRGEHGQSELAHMMDTVSTVLPPAFVVSTGDNFYPDGVTSTTDPHWQVSFEDVYPSGHGLNCPWYMVLGNHDYHGNMQAQFDYSDISERWSMPSFNYYKDFEKNGTALRMVFLDTNPLVKPYYSEGKFKNKVTLQDTAQNLNWMDSLFADDTKHWKIAIGHHPVYSGDYRRDEMRSVRGHLAHRFKANDVNIYFNGHEHVIHHAKPEGPTHYITSGAGSKVSDAPGISSTVYAASVSGFVIASVTPDSIYCQVVSAQGDVVCRTSIK